MGGLVVGVAQDYHRFLRQGHPRAITALVRLGQLLGEVLLVAEYLPLGWA